MNSLADSFTLYNGVQIPCLGLGTWQMPEGNRTINACNIAIKHGYRHIDTASCYQNEDSIGRSIEKNIKNRDDIFVTSKVWNTDRSYVMAMSSIDATLDRLRLDYIDLFLIHWPANARMYENPEEVNAETWRALEKMYKDGKTRAIGLSNFLPHHIESLMKTAKVKPMVNQIEFHPGFMQMETVDYCLKNDILVEAWSPLATGEILENEAIEELAAKYEVSTAQLCIRWVLQHGLLPLPKAVKAEHIVNNADVFNFNIEEEDMHILDSLEYCGGLAADPDKIMY